VLSRRVTQKMAGPTGKTDERARFIELTRQGVSSAEVCRILGINPKTSSRWRNGRIVVRPDGTTRRYAPIVEVVVPTISTRFLSEDERTRIADLRRAGMSLRAIAADLGRSPSTISREVRRNASSTGIYRPFHAHKLARRHRARDRSTKIATNPALREEIRGLLLKRWSPALIAQHLRTLIALQVGDGKRRMVRPHHRVR
jgi:transposase, IS30 family